MGFYKTFPVKKEPISRYYIKDKLDYVGFVEHRENIQDITYEWMHNNKGIDLHNGSILICDEDGSVWVYAEIVNPESPNNRREWFETKYIIDSYVP